MYEVCSNGGAGICVGAGDTPELLSSASLLGPGCPSVRGPEDYASGIVSHSRARVGVGAGDTLESPGPEQFGGLCPRGPPVRGSQDEGRAICSFPAIPDDHACIGVRAGDTGKALGRLAELLCPGRSAVGGV